MTRLLQDKLQIDTHYVPKGTPDIKKLIKNDQAQYTIQDIEKLIVQAFENKINRKAIINYLQLIKIIIEEIQNNEKTTKISLKGAGRFSLVFTIGDKVLKIGYKRKSFQIPYIKEILQPIIRKEFDNLITIEVAEKVKTNRYDNLSEDEIEREIYKIWKSVRQQGALQ